MQDHFLSILELPWTHRPVWFHHHRPVKRLGSETEWSRAQRGDSFRQCVGRDICRCWIQELGWCPFLHRILDRSCSDERCRIFQPQLPRSQVPLVRPWVWQCQNLAQTGQCVEWFQGYSGLKTGKPESLLYCPHATTQEWVCVDDGLQYRRRCLAMLVGCGWFQSGHLPSRFPGYRF